MALLAPCGAGDHIKGAVPARTRHVDSVSLKLRVPIINGRSFAYENAALAAEEAFANEGQSDVLAAILPMVQVAGVVD